MCSYDGKIAPMNADIKQLYEMVASLQAEVSALRQLIFESNPALAKAHQDLTNTLRQQMLAALRENGSHS